MNFNYVDFHFGSISCEIGTGEELAPDIENAILVGSFALFPYLDSNLLSFPMKRFKIMTNNNKPQQLSSDIDLNKDINDLYD